MELSGKIQVIKYGSGSFDDSDYVRPSLFKSDVGNRTLIILAENGADFSYGIDAYLLDGSNMKYMGYMDASVEGVDNPESAVPFIKINEYNNKKIVFTFTKDLLILQANGNYKTVPKEKIKYMYNGTRIVKIVGKKK